MYKYDEDRQKRVLEGAAEAPPHCLSFSYVNFETSTLVSNNTNSTFFRECYQMYPLFCDPC